MAAQPKDMKAFLLVWVGQVFSMVGTVMTTFAMGVWAWEKTGQATPLALMGFFTMAPLIIVTPIAGVLVDRWNRKKVMALSDVGAGMPMIIAISGILALGVGLGAFQNGQILHLENLIPDHDEDH